MARRKQCAGDKAEVGVADVLVPPENDGPGAALQSPVSDIVARLVGDDDAQRQRGAAVHLQDPWSGVLDLVLAGVIRKLEEPGGARHRGACAALVAFGAAAVWPLAVALATSPDAAFRARAAATLFALGQTGSGGDRLRVVQALRDRCRWDEAPEVRAVAQKALNALE